MRFIADGPDIPMELIQAYDEGRLVFFCGAGVSSRAGLPGFKGLVNQVYENLKMEKDDIEQEEYQRKSYERVLGLLEQRLNAPESVREEIIFALELTKNANLSTHEALLRLATSKNQQACRLVTTNYDRGFILAGQDGKRIDKAPKLSVPKKSKWQNLIHLHGLIDEEEDPEGKNLVVTSADFGAAYLTEGWASRFVTELFHRYTILFVGYSVNDPVMRYVVDALAVDRASGDQQENFFAFVGCETGKENQTARAWKAKNVTPIIYSSNYKHIELHKTLIAWANTVSGGLAGKKQLISQHANADPNLPSSELIDRVCWALSEPDGSTARFFAGLDPVPPVSWLTYLAQAGLFSSPVSMSDKQLEIPVADNGNLTQRALPLSPISLALCRWLSKHLDRAELINWVLQKGGGLHPEFMILIDAALDSTTISLPQKLFWQLLLHRCRTVNFPDFRESHQLCQTVKKGEWNLLTRERAINSLSPYVEFGTHWQPEMKNESEETGPSSLQMHINTKVRLPVGDCFPELMQAIDQNRDREEIFSSLLEDISKLLHNALELQELTGEITHGYDYSHIYFPSISPHPQNDYHDHGEWRSLIEISRECWLARFRQNPDDARQQAEKWLKEPFSTYKRLGLFAMNQSGLFLPSETVAILLGEDAHLLWFPPLRRERLRLLASIWPQLKKTESANLISAILAGPPREMFRQDLTSERWQEIMARKQWLLLAKLESFGKPLPEKGKSKLKRLSKLYPEWQLQKNESDEFLTWSEVTDWEPQTGYRIEQLCQLSPQEVIDLLTSAKTRKGDLLMQWRSAAGQSPKHATEVLLKLVKENNWDNDIWQHTLEGFPAPGDDFSVWDQLKTPLAEIPREIIHQLIAPISHWLREQTQDLPPDKEEGFWKLWDALYEAAFQYEADLDSEPVARAIYHPAGHLTEALIWRLKSRNPKAGEGLPEAFTTRADKIVTDTEGAHLLGNVILASRLVNLFSIDPEWTEKKLLPLLNWESDPQAAYLWQGYLWSPGMPPGLWTKLHSNFITTMKNHADLGNFTKTLFQLFTFIALDENLPFPEKDRRQVLQSIGHEGRKEVASTIYRYLANAEENKASLWEKRVYPRIIRLWPKGKDDTDPNTSLQLALTAIETENAFSKAVPKLTKLMVPTATFFSIVNRLSDKTLPEDYPGKTLSLLGAIISTDCPYPQEDLRKLLCRIVPSNPTAQESKDFKKLDEYLLRRGH